ASFCGKAGQYLCTGASGSSLPRSASCMAATAVIGFETEARRNSVADVAGTLFSRSASPNPEDQTGSPSSTTATPTPGALLDVMKSEAALLIAALFSSESVFCCAPAIAGTARSRKQKNPRALLLQKKACTAAVIASFIGKPRRGVYRRREAVRQPE